LTGTCDSGSVVVENSQHPQCAFDQDTIVSFDLHAAERAPHSHANTSVTGMVQDGCNDVRA